MRITLRSLANAGLLTLVVGLSPAAHAQNTPNASPTMDTANVSADNALDDASQRIDRMASIVGEVERIFDQASARLAAQQIAASTNTPPAELAAPAQPDQTPSVTPPENPAQPETPAQPQSPQPENPAQPQPETPVTPGNPGTPNDATPPENTAPDTQTAPETPAQPEAPMPESPAQPEAPDPGQQTNPDQPTAPDQPRTTPDSYDPALSLPFPAPSTTPRSDDDLYQPQANPSDRNNED